MMNKKTLCKKIELQKQINIKITLVLQNYTLINNLLIRSKKNFEAILDVYNDRNNNIDSVDMLIQLNLMKQFYNITQFIIINYFDED